MLDCVFKKGKGQFFPKKGVNDVNPILKSVYSFLLSLLFLLLLLLLFDDTENRQLVAQSSCDQDNTCIT